MKKYFLLISLLLILAITILSTSSCNKKTEAVPDYPQLIGHWTGSTSQGTAIYFTVVNMDGNLKITRYDLTLLTLGGYQQYKVINSNGIAYIKNRYFKIHIGSGNSGEAFIDGTFDVTNLTLEGSYAAYPAGNTTDIITGNYNCIMGD